MGLIKNLLIAVLVVLSIGAVGYVALRYLPTEKWFGRKITTENLVPFIQEHYGQAQQLTAALPIPQVGNILGAFSEERKKAPKDVPVYQQAFEYSRYQYCQQVVQDYEKRYSSEEKATETPAE